MTSREFRNTFSREGAPFVDTPSNCAKVQSGKYGPNITVQSDGQIIISPDAYVDDIVAFSLGLIKNHRGISDKLKVHLGKFVEQMDIRAMTTHGFKDSPDEKEYNWIPLVDESDL